MLNGAVPPVAQSLIVVSPMKPAVLVASLGAVVSALGVTAILWVTNLWLTARSRRRCAIFVGTTPLGPAVRERVPACTQPRPPFPLMPHLVGLLLAATGVGVASLAGRLERGG